MNLLNKSLKSSYLLAFLSLSLVFMIALAYITRSRYKKHMVSLVNQSTVYVQKNSYLKRCIDYQFIINKEDILSIGHRELIIYFTGQTCYSCVESLLLLLIEEYGLENRISVLVDNPQKEELVVSLNDGFRLNILQFTDVENVLTPIDNVLLIKIINGKVGHILEYKPEEKHIFKEYFEYFILPNVNSEN